MIYDIISSGSKGNATVINTSILIDCGVPFKALKDYYKKLQLVLLTHIHGDHFNKATIKKLSQERPTLRWGCCEWLVAPLIACGVDKCNIDVYGINSVNSYYNFIVESFELVHNVDNCGYKITSSNFGRIIYATDTSSLNGITAENYDLYLIEANHTDIEIRERIQEKQESGEFCYELASMNNHLSRKKADEWLLANMGANSQYVYMHQHS